MPDYDDEGEKEEVFLPEETPMLPVVIIQDEDEPSSSDFGPVLEEEEIDVMDLLIPDPEDEFQQEAEFDAGGMQEAMALIQGGGGTDSIPSSELPFEHRYSW